MSVYTVGLRDGRVMPEILNIQSSHISFFNCTAATFDPAGQPDVEFISCLATTSKSFNFPGYVELSYVNNCAAISGTSTTSTNQEGVEKILENQTVTFAGENDYHLSAKDTVAKGKGSPALGADIDGDPRKGNDIGADAVK